MNYIESYRFYRRSWIVVQKAKLNVQIYVKFLRLTETIHNITRASHVLRALDNFLFNYPVIIRDSAHFRVTRYLSSRLIGQQVRQW